MLKEQIQLLHETAQPFTASLAKSVKGGYLLETKNEAFKGVRIFLPGSRSKWGFMSVEDFDEFEVSILNFEPGRRQVVVSARDSMKSKVEDIKRDFVETLYVGQTVKGKVRDINEFGVFVNIGPMDALLHDSEAHDEYELDKEVELVVKFIDFKRNRISLCEKDD